MITLHQIDAKTVEAYQEKTNKRLYRFDLTVKDLTKDIFKLYKPVAQFLTDNLDEAFEIDNIGDESNGLLKKVFTSTSHHSMSVGDIVTKNNECYMVARFGFDKIDINKWGDK